MRREEERYRVCTVVEDRRKEESGPIEVRVKKKVETTGELDVYKEEEWKGKGTKVIKKEEKD